MKRRKITIPHDRTTFSMFQEVAFEKFQIKENS